MPHSQSTLDVKFSIQNDAFTLRHAGLLALLVTAAILVVGQLYVTLPLTAALAQRFDIAEGRAVLVGPAFGFFYAAGFLIFGPLSDRFGRRRIILAGLAATAIATVFVGLAGGFDPLLAARAAQGLAAAAFPPAALSLVAEALPPAHRPAGVSLMSFAFLGAAPLAQLAAAFWGDLSGLMLALAPLYLVAAAGLLFVAPARPAGGAVAGAFGARLRLLLADPLILAGWAAALTALFGFVALAAGAQAFPSHYDLQALRLAGLPPLLLTFAAAPLTKRYGAPITARCGLLLAALALLCAAMAPASAILVAGALLSAGIALAVPGLIATIAGRAGSDNRGLALAIYSFCLFVGASLAPPAAQALAPFGAGPLWLSAAACLCLAALGLTRASRPR